MPTFVALGCVEVGEKFTVVGVGLISTAKTSYTNLGLGWAVTKQRFERGVGVNLISNLGQQIPKLGWRRFNFLHPYTSTN